MLTKKQLLDISNNSVSRNLKDAAQTALAYREMLEQLEWIYNGGSLECPYCQNSKGSGHSPYCELKKLLERGGQP